MEIRFKPYCSKQAQEIIFSRELISRLVFNNSTASEANSQKHFTLFCFYKN